MTVKDTVREALLKYPSIEVNSLDVYNHLFCAIGNGYDWVDGELVDTCKQGKNILKETDAISFVTNRELDSIKNKLNYYFYMKEKHPEDIEDDSIYSKDLEKDIEHAKESIKEQVWLIMNLEDREEDFAPYTPDSKFAKKITYIKLFSKLDPARPWKWKIHPGFRPKSIYLCNFPDNIKVDWLIAIDRFCWFLYNHLDKLDQITSEDHGPSEDDVRLALILAEQRIKEVISIHINNHEEGLEFLTEFMHRDLKQSYYYICVKYQKNLVV